MAEDDRTLLQKLMGVRRVTTLKRNYLAEINDTGAMDFIEEEKERKRLAQKPVATEVKETEPVKPEPLVNELTPAEKELQKLRESDAPIAEIVAFRAKNGLL